MNKVRELFNKFEKSKYINIYTFIIFCFVLVLFKPIIFHYFDGDDTRFHLANIAARSGNYFDKILPIIGNNLGYGIGIFYPALPHAIGGFVLSIISGFGFSEVMAIKIVKFILVFLSGISVYVLASKIFKNKLKGMFASLFYISSNYLFVDILMRDSFNESFMFLFVPIIFLGLYYLLIEDNVNKFYIFFILGCVGLMYSHLVLSVWFTILLIPFLLVNYKDLFKKYLKPLLLSGLIILILTSTYTVPLIEHKMFGEYTIFNTVNDKIPWTLPIYNFIIQCNYKLSGENSILFINFIPLVSILFVLGVVRLFKDKDSNYKYLLGILFTGVLGALFTSIAFIWNIVPNFLFNIQFAWRLVCFVVFMVSIIAANGLFYFFNIFKKKYLIFAYLFIGFVLISAVYNNILLVRPTDIPSNDVSRNGMGWQREYLPVNTQNNLDYFESRKDDEVIILNGKGSVKIKNNNVPNMEIEVKDSNEKTTLEIPRLYYLGYDITYNGEKINYNEDKNGFISFKANKDGIYNIKYLGTKGYIIALYIKIITIAFLIIYAFYKFKNRKNMVK